MSYRALKLEEIPALEANEVLELRQISTIQGQQPYRSAEQNLRTLVEAERPDDSGTLAAYIDLRPSKRYPRLQVGLTARVLTVRFQSRNIFAVECHASKDGARIGSRFHIEEYGAARGLMLSFINFAGDWLAEDWFTSSAIEPMGREDVLAEQGLESRETSPLSGVFSLLGESDSTPSLEAIKQYARALLAAHFSQQAERIAEIAQQAPSSLQSTERERDDVGNSAGTSTRSSHRVPSEDRSRLLGQAVGRRRFSKKELLAAEALASGNRNGLGASGTFTPEECSSIWERICIELRGLCRIRNSHVCSYSDREIVLTSKEGIVLLRVQLVGNAVEKNLGGTIETIHFVRAKRRGISFAGEEKIPSIPRLAAKLLHDASSVLPMVPGVVAATRSSRRYPNGADS